MIGEPQDPPDMEDMDEMEDMGQLLDSMQPMKPLVRGDVVEGIVMRADSDGILVNVGHKAEGVIPPGEMRSTTREGVEAPKIGDEIVAMVIKGETAEGGAVPPAKMRAIKKVISAILTVPLLFASPAVTQQLSQASPSPSKSESI